MSFDICQGCKLPTFRCECKPAAPWLDIATAPLDGTRVLLAWAGQPAVLIGWYGEKLSGGGVNYGDEWGAGTGWRDRFLVQPTHWMPLPEPPRV